MLRQTEKATGRAKKVQGAQGERPRDARREREIRDFTQAVNKGHRNAAIDNFLKR